MHETSDSLERLYMTYMAWRENFEDHTKDRLDVMENVLLDAMKAEKERIDRELVDQAIAEVKKGNKRVA